LQIPSLEAARAANLSRAYPMKPGERDGKPLTPEGLAAVVAEEGWLSEDEARRQLRELCDRGDQLARLLR